MTGTKTVERTKISCPNCGAPVTLRTFANASRVICEYCDSLIDNSNQGLSIVEQFHERAKIKPRIPLGSRGKFEDKTFEVVGFLRRRGPGFQWYEYVLFNPYYGFRYLADSDRHWNYITPMPVALKAQRSGGHPILRYKDRDFKRFATYQARVDYVLGEFPWRVQTDDIAVCRDYIDPPHIISEEKSESESGGIDITFSHGVYMPAEEVFAAFGMKVPGGTPYGVAPNQPNPLKSSWQEMQKIAVAAMIAFLVISFLYLAKASGKTVIKTLIPIVQPQPSGVSTTLESGVSEPEFFTSEKFELAGGSRNVVINVYAPVDNSWVWMAGNLVNIETEEAYPFEAEVSYYHGYSGGESWSEGSQSTSLVLGGIPSGEYKLVAATKYHANFNNSKRKITAVVRRDVGLYRYVFIVFLIVAVFPLIHWFRYQNFETSRWAESDYGGSE